MAAVSPRRLFSAWRVEALFFRAAFRFGGPCNLHSICADARPYMTKCLVTHRVSPFSPTLEWPLAQPGEPVQPEHSPPQEDANGDRPNYARLGPAYQRWRRDALQPPEVLRDHSARSLGIQEGSMN